MRILFCSLESPGFLYPAIGLAQALRARGHEVVFATDRQCTNILEAAGLARIPRGRTDGNSFLVGRWSQPGWAAIQVKHIEYALDLFPSDLLIGQSLTLGPLLVAERRRIPVALMGFFTYLWPTSEEAADDTDERQRRLVWRHGDMMKWLNQARSLFPHLPVLQGDCSESPLLGDLFLVRSIPELEPDPDRLPKRVHLVGSCLWEPEEPTDPELEAWMKVDGAAPLIYVQHGRFFHLPSFWPGLVEAFMNLDCRVASSVGRMDSEVGQLPEKFFVRPHISQSRVLRAAQVVVASANTTAVLGALAAGVPSLLIPGGGEQPDVAEVARRAGVAIVLSREEATPERICAAVLSILTEPRFRERALYYRSLFARVDGFEMAADLMERLVSARQPLCRTETLFASR